MQLTIYTLAYNEELVLPFFINHYRSRFPLAHIVLFDNQSTDKTVEIAKENNCEVRNWNTNGVIDDEQMKELKNHCWKDANSSWVIVADPDECLDINEKQLALEEANKTTIIRSKGYNMVNMEDNFHLESMKFGVREQNYDKAYLFNKKYIMEIGYNHGCHKHEPLGDIKYSEQEYLLYHYKYINIDWLIERTKYTHNRLSDINKKMGWGTQWHVNEQQIRDNFDEQRKKTIKVIE